jgi:hypothetical protein
MSALGQKQTYAVQKGMSALHPKADMCSAEADVRFGPKADMKTVVIIGRAGRIDASGAAWVCAIERFG